MNGARARPVSGEPDGSAHQEQTRRLVGAMMTLTGLSATGLARAAGLTPSTINRFLHKPVRHTLSQRTMLALMTETFQAIKDRPQQSLDVQALAALGPAVAVYERGILELAPEVKSALAEAKSISDRATAVSGTPGLLRSGDRISADLPVLMNSTPGVNVQSGDFAQAPLKTQRPPFLEGDSRAFAFLMPDDSMAPRFDAGDMLYVSPARNVGGDKIDAVLEWVGGGFLIGTIVGLTAESVRISILSPRNRESHARNKFRGLYRIVGVQRLAG